MSTLEQAGYVWRPFSTSDIYGQPRGFNFSQTNTNLPVGNDDSALPELANAEYADPTVPHGSSTAQYRPVTAHQVQQNTNMITTGLFLAVLAAALYVQV